MAEPESNDSDSEGELPELLPRKKTKDQKTKDPGPVEWDSDSEDERYEQAMSTPQKELQPTGKNGKILVNWIKEHGARTQLRISAETLNHTDWCKMKAKIP